MAEYIEKKDKNMRNLIEIAIEDNWELDYTLERLEEIPSADVAPIIHAKWIDTGIDGEFKCGNCKILWQDSEENSYEDWVIIARWCPCCGAKMDKE